MNLYASSAMAKDLLKLHGLHEWRFAFDHARRRFGSCRYGQKQITLSRPLTLLNTEPQVRDTILHEIAHALTPGDGHGLKWKRKCAELGALPKRCYTDTQVISPPRREARFLWGCAQCDWWVERRRRTRRKYVCGKCRGGLMFKERAAAKR